MTTRWLTYPVSTAETLIVPVAPLGFTVLGKSPAPTFVLPSLSSWYNTNNNAVSLQNFGISPEEWKGACDTLSQAFHACELPLVVGLLQWVPLVVFAGPAWINIPAERKQREAVYLELARLQQSSILRPRNLNLQLHVSTIHRGRNIEQKSWLSISKTKGRQPQDVLVFSSSHPEKERKHIAFCQSLYQKCKAKVNPSITTT